MEMTMKDAADKTTKGKYWRKKDEREIEVEEPPWITEETREGINKRKYGIRREVKSLKKKSSYMNKTKSRMHKN